MKAGRLRHRVTLQSPNAPGQDATGAATQGYTSVGVYWAEVRTANGFEQNRPELNTVISGYTHTVTLRRPTAAVKTTWRVQWDGRTLNVLAIREPDNRGRSVLLDCIEVEV